ncbi:MAG TPA: hypothetical protein VFL53_21335 [Pseudolabrys sp.]|jgi:hypothetical protein|nr:hypothetical protein [Pseudolabrys sp.]
MVLRNDTIAKAEHELMAMHEREETLKQLLETARREHNEAVANRHRAADLDEAVLAAVNMQVAVQREKFNELADSLADVTTQRRDRCLGNREIRDPFRGRQHARGHREPRSLVVEAPRAERLSARGASGLSRHAS